MATSARNASSSPADEAEEPAAVVHRGTAFELELEYLDIDQAMSLSRGVACLTLNRRSAQSF